MIDTLFLSLQNATFALFLVTLQHGIPFARVRATPCGPTNRFTRCKAYASNVARAPLGLAAIHDEKDNVYSTIDGIKRTTWHDRQHAQPQTS